MDNVMSHRCLLKYGSNIKFASGTALVADVILMAAAMFVTETTTAVGSVIKH